MKIQTLLKLFAFTVLPCFGGNHFANAERDLVAERGAHYRVHLRKSSNGPDRHYVLLKNGMHYKDAGEWKMTEERLLRTPEGPTASRGFYTSSVQPESY